MTKNITAVIPARMAATRFPGKPLKKILGLSMIEHVRRRALLSGLFDSVVVATCDREIIEEVEKNGGKAVMTSNSHERCTDRIEEAAKKINSGIIVNIQGDEPTILPQSLELLIAPLLKNSELQSTNIVNPINNFEDLSSPNAVKAVLSNSLKILYMSRSIIPGKEYSQKTQYYKQTGLMAFRKEFLHLYSTLAPTPLEIKESCDMLRLLENDYSIQGVICHNQTIGVDIPDQIETVEKFILNDPQQKLIHDKIKSS